MKLNTGKTIGLDILGEFDRQLNFGIPAPWPELDDVPPLASAGIGMFAMISGFIFLETKKEEMIKRERSSGRSAEGLDPEEYWDRPENAADWPLTAFFKNLSAEAPAALALLAEELPSVINKKRDRRRNVSKKAQEILNDLPGKSGQKSRRG